MTPLSFYVLTYNSERYLEKILAAAKRVADDLLVVDSGSSDRTLAIAERHGARIVHRPFDNFRAQRLFANSQCRHRMVMFVDSDEIPSDALIDELNRLKQQGFTCDVYGVRREWIVMGKGVHALMPVSCPDYPVRLYKRDVVTFTAHTVHETVTGQRSDGRIEAPLIHHTFETKAEIARKLELYSDLAALDLRGQRKSAAVLWLKKWLSPVGAFAKWYVRKGNIRDGRLGLTLALYAAAYTHRKYRKAFEHG